MNFISMKNINRRGQPYNTRPTRNANGYSRHFGGKVQDRFLKLAVFGTFDILARTRVGGEIIKVRLRHPEDFGYTKASYILRKNKVKFEHLIIKYF